MHTFPRPAVTRTLVLTAANEVSPPDAQAITSHFKDGMTVKALLKALEADPDFKHPGRDPLLATQVCNALTKLVRVMEYGWVKSNTIVPTLPAGTRVKLSGGRTGKIMGDRSATVNHDYGYYCVKPDGAQDEKLVKYRCLVAFEKAQPVGHS